MRFSRTPLLALAAATLLAAPISAATSSTNAIPNLTSAAKSESEAEASSAAASASNTGSAKASVTGSDSAAATTTSGKSIQSSSVIITGSGSSGSASGAVPTITGGSSATSDVGLTGLPTITGAYVIVAPSVPPTSNAPYMQVSSLPEGTVFIVVGAILGFLALSVLLWRGLVAWALHRSVKRAAATQYSTDIKKSFRTPAAPFYKYADRESTISLGAMGGGKKEKKGARPPTAPGAVSASSLFFSPTAGAAGAGGLANSGNRGSSYLPAGYYAAGASQPGNGQGMTHNGQGPSISLSNLGPARDGYARARSLATTPPDSPSFGPQSSGLHGHAYGASSSTLNLNRDTEGRAPSAYLDDLFDGENGLPVPGHGRNESSHRF